MKHAFPFFACGCAVVTTVIACSDDPTPAEPPEPVCENLKTDFRFEHGTANGGDGHADPFGAKAAGQARAGRIKDASQIVQGPIARHKVRVGDFAIANDKIALYIESENRPNGYSPFGGEILAIEPVGEDGKPTGKSQYGETLIALSRQAIKPDKVTVIADGADGKAAIIRMSGVFTNIPFMDTFKAISADEYGFPGALDYVLEPHAEKVLLRLSVANTGTEPVDFVNRQNVGFFHSSRLKVFTEAAAFANGKGPGPYAAYDAVDNGFVFRAAGGGSIAADLEVSGFRLFTLTGLKAEACEKKTVDYLEITTANGGIDALLEAKRRAYGEPAWREVKATVTEEGGGALAGAFVHASSAADGKYLTRGITNDQGEVVLHVPNGAVALVPTLQGWAIPPATSNDGPTAAIVMPKRATIEVKATDATTNEALPVRVQIIPTVPPVAAPAQYGIREERDGRLWQEFAMNGTALLPVPPGQHRVVVSRGYEYEIFDAPVTAEAGKTVTVDAKIKHTVDTTGVMCADFHIHSFYSADSSDPVEMKVKSAVADGLDIPCSSEHEWIIDFAPVVQKLGVSKWAFGMSSEELTTFTWGHFGVIPIYPKPDQPNNGAVDWVGKKPPAFFHQVAELPEKPALIINHPTGQGFSSYFTAAGLDKAKGTGDPELWSDEFTAVEVFNASDLEENRGGSLADWFGLLNANKTYWAVGASDSHDIRGTAVGYPRTCLAFGHDDTAQLTGEIVRDKLRSGAITVSGGLYMTVIGPNNIGPGGTATPGEYKIVVQAPSWLASTAAITLETIVDGVTTETKPLTVIVPATGTPPFAKRYEATVNVAAASSRPRHWVLFHAKGDGDLSPLQPKNKPFAVSNPIFFP